MTKETYVTPEMETLGSFEALTQSTSTGQTFDAAAMAANPGSTAFGVLS